MDGSAPSTASAGSLSLSARHGSTMSLTSLLTTDLILDGRPVRIGDGANRARSIRIDSGIATPFWIRFDLSPLKIHKVESLPTTVACHALFIEALSYDPRP